MFKTEQTGQVPSSEALVNIDVRHTEALLNTGALQRAIFNSANFSSIATDAKGVIQIFNVGAERSDDAAKFRFAGDLALGFEEEPPALGFLSNAGQDARQVR